MRIAIDLIPIIGKEAGLQRYAQLLIKGLAEFDKENEYIILQNEKIGELFFVKQDNFQNIKVKTPPKIHFFWEQIYLPIYRLFKDFDLLHSPVSAPPYIYSGNYVITVYDITFILYPETMNKISRFYWDYFMNKGVKRANKVIAVSENTKRDLVNYYNISQEKIKVIPIAVMNSFNSSSKDYFKGIKDKYNLPEKYLLYVGTLEPRKNLERLLQAFHKIKSMSDFKHKLVIAGKEGWLFSNIYETVGKLGLNEEVVFTGFVPDEDLPGIYSQAEIFVFPSLYEGFGLPPLEAMACGIPVLVSNSSSLPEVVGDAGIFVNPNDTDDIAKGILQLLESKELREGLGEKGIRRAKKFSVEKMIKETLMVYKEVNDEDSSNFS